MAATRPDIPQLPQGGRSRIVRLIAAGVLVGAGLLVLSLTGVLSGDEKGATTTRNGVEVRLESPDVSLQTAPVAGLSVGLRQGDIAPDFEFSSFEGERMKLSDLRGRPVLLNFWATWCGPCRVELPDMEQLLRTYSAQQFAAIAVNKGQRFATADAYLQEIEVDLTAFAYDPASAIAKRYEVQGLPISYFIDARGVIVKVVTGQLTRTIMESGAQAALTGTP